MIPEVNVLRRKNYYSMMQPTKGFLGANAGEDEDDVLHRVAGKKGRRLIIRFRRSAGICSVVVEFSPLR